jgi:hypothetical protein
LAFTILRGLPSVFPLARAFRSLSDSSQELVVFSWSLAVDENRTVD